VTRDAISCMVQSFELATSLALSRGMYFPPLGVSEFMDIDMYNVHVGR
jgi:hypothetical protein